MKGAETAARQKGAFVKNKMGGRLSTQKLSLGSDRRDEKKV
jgi:hypothetical protein